MKSHFVISSLSITGLIGITVAHMFDIDIPGISSMEDRVNQTFKAESKKVETENKVDRTSDKDGDR